MYKYHCLNPIAACGLEQFDGNYEKTENVNEADAILVRSAAMHDMEFSDQLSGIARAGAGVNNIPLDACAQKGIVVFNTPGANANGVKELVLAGMLLASRDVVGGIEWVASQKGNAEVGKQAEKEKKKLYYIQNRGVRINFFSGSFLGNFDFHRSINWYGIRL